MNALKTFFRITLTVIAKLIMSIIGTMLIINLAFFLGDHTTNFRTLSTFITMTILLLSTFLFPWIFPLLVKKYDKLKAGLIWIGVPSVLLLICFVGLCIEWPRDGAFLSHLKSIGADIGAIIIFTFAASFLLRRKKAPQHPAE